MELWYVITIAAAAGIVGAHLYKVIPRAARGAINGAINAWKSARGLRPCHICMIDSIAIEAMPTVPQANVDWLVKTEMFTRFVGKWKRNTSPVTIHRICILDATPFGPPASAKVGMAYIKSYVDKPVHNGKKFIQKSETEITFLRSDAVSVLVPAEYAGKLYLILCNQLRIADSSINGRDEFHNPKSVISLFAEYGTVETIAGMIAGGKVCSVATKELEEEAHIHIRESDLHDVGFVMPSIGGCNEKIHQFVTKTPFMLTEAQYHKLSGQHIVTGLDDEGECIINKLIPIEEWKTVPDMKLHSLMAFVLSHAIETPGEHGIMWTERLLKK